LKRDGFLKREDIDKLINLSTAILKAEGNLVYANDPITVVGDIHGQFYDMLKLLNVGGDPETTKYLFLGDFVDRGTFSIEVMLMVMALKISFPSTIFVLRGNHECRQMTSCFNFRQECLVKYDQEIYSKFITLFDSMPLSAIINGKFIAFHGGISPELKTLNDINKIDRFKEPPKSGILWYDQK
jgi:serine/threonine-protein phosphatase 2B catalytic subunit